MDPTFFALFVALGVVHTALGIHWLLAGSSTVTMGRVGTVALRLTALSLVEATAGLPFGLHPFGVLQIAWLDLTAVAPMCGLAMLLARRRGRAVAPGVSALAAVSLLVLPLAGWMQLVEPFAVRLERVEVPVPAARAGSDPVRIGVVSDVQSPAITEHERRAVARLMDASPDLVLVPGDLFQGPGAWLEAERGGFVDLLRRLDCPGGVWIVAGNCDWPRALESIVAGAGLAVLRDETVRVAVGDRTLTLLGVDERPSELAQLWRERIPAVEALASAPGDDDIRIVLAHRPGLALSLPPDGRIDLLVGGHTHGGQVALPLLGPPITLSALPRRVAAGGLHELHGNLVYVSRGLGMERKNAPRIRLGAPPEVALLTLRSAPGEL